MSRAVGLLREWYLQFENEAARIFSKAKALC